MYDLLLHDRTKTQLENYISNPSHAMLLIGSAGSGKFSLVQSIAAQLLPNRNEAHFKTVEAEKDKQSIGIESIRDLQLFTKLKLASVDDKRIICVTDAQLLTTEAQNAFLKLLEEPSHGTHFILSATSEQQLLPTIRSRVQNIVVHRPDRQQVEEYFLAKDYAAKDVAQAYSLSGGLPGLMSSILGDEAHPLRQTVQSARQLLQMTQFERLTQVDTLSKDKPGTMQLLQVLQLMARTALEQTASKALAASTPADKPLRQWHKILRASYEAEQAYAASAQSKLTLTNLMLAL